MFFTYHTILSYDLLPDPSLSTPTHPRPTKTYPGGAWDHSGRRFWSPSATIEVNQPSSSNASSDTAVASLEPESLLPVAGMIDCRSSSGGRASSINHGGLTGGASLSGEVGAAERLRRDVFKVASTVPGLADISDALMEAGAQPQDLLSNPLVLSVIASTGSSRVCGDSGGTGSSSCMRNGLDLYAAVRCWEDWQRRICGPSMVVTMSDWPTCFATHRQSDDVIAGTSGGLIAVLRPGGGWG